MKVLMLAAEAVPYAKTGGLADVAGILPKFLAQQGDDVRVVMPLYGSIDREKYGLRPIPGALGVPMGILGELWCEIYESTLPNTDVPVYFIAYEQYFGRKNLYNEENGEAYKDNDNRYLLLAKAALQLCKKLDFTPDIIHANDWHTAVAPVFLNTFYRNDTHLGKTASLLTIHNIGYQGQFYAGVMDVLGIGWHHFHHLGLEQDGGVNLLKGGIYHSTLFNTVSPNYAEEIKTPAFGNGLDGVIRDRAWALRGVLNGMDYEEWDPSNDPFIAAPYDVGDMDGKRECKRALQKEMGLAVRDDVPVFGMVARLVEQKGIHVLATIFEALMRLDLQIAILGSGEEWVHHFLDEMARRYPGKFGLYLGYSNALAHRVEAGSDFFLMPSDFEHCGLNQLFSLRYGSIPIVHAVGGLDDTVENFDPYHRRGTGFKYHDQTPGALYNTIGWALHTYYHEPDQIEEMRERGMKKRFSWEGAAKQYRALYEEAIRIKG